MKSDFAVTQSRVAGSGRRVLRGMAMSLSALGLVGALAAPVAAQGN